MESSWAFKESASYATVAGNSGACTHDTKSRWLSASNDKMAHTMTLEKIPAAVEMWDRLDGETIKNGSHPGFNTHGIAFPMQEIANIYLRAHDMVQRSDFPRQSTLLQVRGKQNGSGRTT